LKTWKVFKDAAMSKTIPLTGDHFYHIYNRGNNGEDLFREPRNYSYFLQLYIRYAHPVVDTYAYCLMKNHFHLLVRMKSEAELANVNLPGFQNLEGFSYAQRFSNLFNAYTKAINKAYQRSGSLFEKNFDRILIDSDSHLTHLVCYIHRNPQKHGFCDNFRDYPYSSYQAIAQNKNTRINRLAVLEWFGSLTAFENYHAQFDQMRIRHLIGDDD
jgi:putative transposase